MTIWQLLDIEETTDLTVIKKAYAVKVKLHKPEVDPDGFQLLREAYERAQKFSAGLQINPELNAPEKTVAKPEPTFNDVSDHPEHAAYYILETLTTDEKKAIELIETLKTTNRLANLDFSAQFQRILAIELLKATRQQHLFIHYLAGFFNWYEQIHHATAQSIFIIAITNLVNKIEYVDCYHRLMAMSQITSQEMAVAQNINWDECVAVQILMSSLSTFNFYSIVWFEKAKAELISNMAIYLKTNYPEIIFMGFNLKSIDWWLQLNVSSQGKRSKKSKNKLVVTILSVIYLSSVAIQTIIQLVDDKANTTINHPTAIEASAEPLTDSQTDLAHKNKHSSHQPHYSVHNNTLRNHIKDTVVKVDTSELTQF